MPKNPDEIGALWLKDGPKGKYMSGLINGEPVVVFKNRNKAEGSKQPDYNVLKSKKRESLPGDVTRASAADSAEPGW